MANIISDKEQQLLVKQSELKDFYTNDYLTNPNNINFQTISKLFFNNDEEKTKIYNVGSNMFATIADTIANFVGNPVIDIEFDLIYYIIDLISVGHFVIGIKRLEDQRLIPYYIPAEDYIFTNKQHKVIKQYSEINGDKINYYILKQTYEVGRTINELFKINTPSDITGEKVKLDTIPQTAHLQDITITGLDRPALFVGVGESLLNKIKNLVYSLDRKQVMFETQFLQEIEQYKIFDNIDLQPYADSTGKITKPIGKILANIPGMQGDIKYISNANPLIKDAIEYEQTQLRKISSATSIPTDFLGLNNPGAISGTSREILIQNFIKTIEKYRNYFEDVLKELLKLLEGQLNEEGKPITTNIIWNEIITKSDKELIEELKIAREAGLISQFTGIKLYLGVKDEQAQQELDLILNENNNEGVGKN